MSVPDRSPRSEAEGAEGGHLKQHSARDVLECGSVFLLGIFNSYRDSLGKQNAEGLRDWHIKLAWMAVEVANIERDRETALRECARLREEVRTLTTTRVALLRAERDRALVQAAEASERAYLCAQDSERVRAMLVKNSATIRQLRAERRQGLRRLAELRADIWWLWRNLNHRCRRSRVLQ